MRERHPEPRGRGRPLLHLGMLLLFLLGASELRAGIPLEVAEVLEKGDLRSALGGIRERARDRTEGAAWASWVWYQARRYPKAVEWAEKALAGGYTDPLPVLVLARVEFLRGEAEAALARVEGLGPRGETIEGLCLRGELLLGLGRQGQAAEAFTACIERFNATSDPDPEQRLMAARAGRLNRDPYGAVKHLDLLLQRHPWMVRAHFEMGELFLEHYQTGDAVASYREGLAIRPRSPGLRGALSLALFLDDQLPEAVAEAKQALEVDPLELRAWETLARLSLRKGDHQAAKHAAEQGSRRNPRDSRAMALRAEVHLAAGEVVEAERLGQELRSRDPTFTDLDRALAREARLQGRPQEALEHLARALARNPRCSACFFQRGELHLVAGRLTAAREDLERARFLDPFLVKAVNFLKILDRFEVFGHHRLQRGVLALSPYGPSSVRPYLQEELDGLVQDLEKVVGHQLRESLRVEVFGDQTWMNARALGLGLEFGEGFSFGPCLTFRVGESEPGGMAWRRTMRHELVHSFHADWTAPIPVPHWFTEGLATRLEGPRGEVAEGVLRGAFLVGDLSGLEDLVAWRAGGARLYLHYLQGAVAMDWILSRGGGDAHSRFLDAFARGRSSEEAFQDVLGSPPSQLADDYRAFLEARCRTLRAEPVYRSLPEDLAERGKQGDPDALTRLAALALAQGDLPRAGILLEPLVGPEARALAARVRHRKGEPGALAALEAAVGSWDQDYALWLDLAVARDAAGDPAGAMQALERAHAVHPGGRQAVYLLASRYRAAGRPELRRRVLEELLERDPDHAWVARELSRAARARGEREEAVRLLRQALGTDASRPALLLELARLQVERGELRHARRAYAAFAGLSRTGLGPSRKGLPVPEQLRLSAPRVTLPHGAAPDSGERHWLDPVPVEARTRDAASLAEELARESRPGIALAGLVDALGRELDEWGGKASGDGASLLDRALLGRLGPRPARAAALALGRQGRREAAPFLLASLQVEEEGPFGEGELALASLETLEGLASTGREDLEPWWGGARSHTSEDWFRRSLRERGYPDPPEEPDGEAKLLTIVLEDDSWYRAQGAWQRLATLLGSRAGRGAFGPRPHRDRVFEPIRAQARASFRRLLEERSLARRKAAQH